MEYLSRFSLPGLLFILTVIFGFWMSQLGKPYNGVLFNVHKLIALAAVVLSVIQTTQALREGRSQALSILLLCVVAACVIALFASGALMSLEKMNYTVLLSIHRVAPILSILALAAALILLAQGRNGPV